MEAIAALSLASNIIQVVDFSSRLVSRTHQLYTSTDGRVEEHANVVNVAERLRELQSDLQLSGSSDKQLQELRNETDKVVAKLSEALNKAGESPDRNKRWDSVYKALRSVCKDEKIAGLARQLDNIRQQVNTAVLVSINSSVSLKSESGRSRLNEKIELMVEEGTRERHDEILSAIASHGWQTSQPHDMVAFSAQLGSFSAAELHDRLERRFRQIVLSRLYFRQMPDRADAIHEAHRETFEWLFKENFSALDREVKIDFVEWLQKEDSNIYWITGKPGSGKSTLMKFLYHHPTLPSLLQKWAKQQDLVKAGFYFWNSGSAVQKSRSGLLRSLLHNCFTQKPALLIQAMSTRWEEFLAFGGGRDPFEEPELQRIFDQVISDPSQRFFFLIDGLDEFVGESKDIIDFVFGAARPNVKLCVASRPWLKFEDAFGQRPSLLLENLTRRDIAAYVSNHFLGNDHFARLQSSKPEAAATLLLDIVEKASGVFFWVYLVVQSLLEGLQNEDRLQDLQVRLEALPEDLEALFEKLLGQLDSDYFRQACELFRLLRSYYDTSQLISGDTGNNPTLLDLYFADDEDTKSSLRAPFKRLDASVALQQSETMRRRINARCRGFLEVHVTDSKPGHGDKRVGYLHRTARDFIESDDYWPTVLERTGHASFKPVERWANAMLWLHKAYPYVSSNTIHRDKMCLKSAVILQTDTGVVQKSYLDQFFIAQLTHSHNGQDPGDILTVQLHAVSQERELAGYLALILDEASPRQRSVSLKDGGTSSMHYSGDMSKVVSYYGTPRYARWLHRRPALPRSE